MLRDIGVLYFVFFIKSSIFGAFVSFFETVKFDITLAIPSPVLTGFATMSFTF